MKKLILFLGLSVLVTLLKAQVPSYLDLTVSESLEKQPKSMDYQLRVTFDHEEELDLDRDYDMRRKMMRSRIKENENQLKKFLETNKITYATQQEENFSISQDDVSFTIFKIKVNNQAELENLVTLLRQLTYVEGHIGNKMYEDKEKDELVLFEKLYQKAHSKAQKMAALMNCTVGKILEVEDINQESVDYYEMLEGIGYEPPNPNEMSSGPLNLIIKYSMRFRFELIHK